MFETCRLGKKSLFSLINPNSSYYKSFYDENQSPPFRIQLGLTDYRSYVGSNLGSKWKIFYDEGAAIHDVNAFFGNPLGNISVIILKDGYHVLMKRGYNVAEAQGRLTCVGGHPEPSVLLFVLVYSRMLEFEIMMMLWNTLFEMNCMTAWNEKYLKK